MAYGDFKDLTRRTASDKILRNKVFNNAKNAKQYGCQTAFASMVYKFFDKKSSGGGIANVRLASCGLRYVKISKKVTKTSYQNLQNRKVQSPFIDNIWSADLADMQLISKFNKGFMLLAWIIPLKDKKGITLPMIFRKL